MKLAGKVAIVGGASRGIGKDIALAFAVEGAKVVVVARSEVEPDPRLPGTIHQTVAEIQAAGGEAIAVKADISDEAQVDTKPQLEIFADDVKCAHGAAIGQLEEDELFYLESRGIRPDLARNVLTYGFAEEVIEKIKIASIKRELDEVVLHRLRTSF